MYTFSKEILYVLGTYTFLEAFVFKTVVEVVYFLCCLTVVIGVTSLSQCGRIHVYGIETCSDDVSVNSRP